MKRFSIVAILVLTSCGYALVGTGKILDPSIKTLYVPTFVNRTTRVGLEQSVTQSVADEFVSRGRLRIVNDPKEADIILRGSMDSFNLAPVGFVQGRATQYQVSVTANIELLDHRHEDKVLWNNNQYRFVENYEVNLDRDAFDQESRAISEIAQKFAQSLVANLLEGF